jgi:catechol 2,3-dioxygenase-like lactoylglutathione lyase family enzyme
MNEAKQKIAAIAIVVRDYDEAKDYYSSVLGFEVVEDTPLGNGKRWVLVKPPGASQTHLLLAQASTPEQLTRVGNQTGGRVFLFLHTDDFQRDYEAFRARGVQFRRSPSKEPYGTVAVFQDLYGNLWDLIEPSF